MSIRKQLLALSVVSAVPLLIVGAIALHSLWSAGETELEKTLEQRAQLASVALERWIEAQRQPLNTIATYRSTGLDLPSEYFRLMVATRPHWVDLRILDNSGRELASWPKDAASLPENLKASLLVDLLLTKTWEITTDWTAQAADNPMLVIATPIKSGGSVILRARAEAMEEVFRDADLPHGAVLYVSDRAGRVLYHSSEEGGHVGSDIAASPVLKALDGRRTAVVETESPLDGVRRIYGLARAGETGCVVKIAIPTSTLFQPARQQFMRYLFYSVLGLASAFVAALLISRRISRPIRELRNMAHHVGMGGTLVSTSGKGGGELAELQEAFNFMATRIVEREDNLKDLNTRLSQMNELKSEIVSGVSHELRTPLTTIKMLSRLMLHNELSESERRESLEVIAMECDRQIDLVLNLLDLSRIEAGALDYILSQVDILEVLHVCARVERHAAHLRGHEFSVILPAELPPVRTDRRAVRRVLCSIIENAIKYTPERGRITLSARSGREEVFIDVSDTGHGILEEDYPFVFDKFWRGRRPVATREATAGDRSSAEPFVPEVPGAGLGLYLARIILEQLGGGISFVSRVGHGTTFTVRLPLWQEPAAAVAGRAG